MGKYSCSRISVLALVFLFSSMFLIASCGDDKSTDPKDTRTAVIDLSETELDFAIDVGDPDPSPQVVSITNTGTGELSGLGAYDQLWIRADHRMVVCDPRRHDRPRRPHDTDDDRRRGPCLEDLQRHRVGRLGRRKQQSGAHRRHIHGAHEIRQSDRVRGRVEPFVKLPAREARYRSRRHAPSPIFA